LIYEYSNPIELLVRLFKKTVIRHIAEAAEAKLEKNKLSQELEELGKTLVKVIEKAKQREEEIIKKVGIGLS
jgi:rRNA pseudouridine-1189 N-methylase Emg1 (Nep1/Mra1 family)